MQTVGRTTSQFVLFFVIKREWEVSGLIGGKQRRKYTTEIQSSIVRPIAGRTQLVWRT